MAEILNIQVRYRPLRIGLCVDNQDLEALREAVRLTHVFWGGCFNPIIPVDDEALARQLISTFRVDFLWAVSETEKTKKLVQSLNYLPYPFLLKELFPKINDQRISQILDISHPIKSIYEEFYKNTKSTKIESRLYQWDEYDPLSDVFLMTLGGYPNKDVLTLDYQDLLTKTLCACQIKIDKEHEHPSDIFDTSIMTPYNLTRYSLKKYRPIQNGFEHHGFYIGKCNKFEDLVSYWNLKAAGIKLFFYDEAHIGRFKTLKERHIAQITDTTPRYPELGKRVALYFPNVLESDNTVYTEFKAELLPLHIIDCSNQIWNGLNIKPLYMYIAEKHIIAPLHEGDRGTSLTLQLPDNKWFYDDHMILNQQHFFIAIDSGIGLSFRNPNETFDVPYLPELNLYYGANYCYSFNSTRVEPERLGIITSITASYLKLNALKVDSLIAEIFKLKKIITTPSQAGIICKHLIHQIGGLPSCNVFRVAGLRDLIKQYNVTKSFIIGDAMKSINTEFAKYENLFIEQRDFNLKLKPEDVFTYLLKKKAFRAGLEFKCPNCHLKFWLSLDELKNDLNCTYCGKNFDANLYLKDNKWQYKRSGLFGKDNHQEGAIPVIIMLEQLLYSSCPSLSKRLYSTAMKLESKEYKINCETDFIIIGERNRGGRIQVAIGECKDIGKQDKDGNFLDTITDDDVNKLKTVVEALRDRFDIYTIFVKLSEFTQTELARLETLNEEHYTRLILLTTNDLESDHLYQNINEDVKTKLGRYIYDLSFHGMAQITEELYYPNSD